MKDLRSLMSYEVSKVQFEYILDCIQSDDVDVEQMTVREKVEYLFNVFNDEFGDYNTCMRYSNTNERLADWLRGLPSVIGIAFIDYDIEQIGKSWGFCKTEEDTTNFVRDWFDIIAFWLLIMYERIMLHK